jgi:hypothetical protein
MRLRNRMGPMGKGIRAGRRAGLWMELKRVDWIGFMPGWRGISAWGCRRHHRRRQESMEWAGWRRGSWGIPCWGLGAVAGWPWG